tara:strand:- start:7672 stop:8841 length:1170 start_codon:yes stop_codon:yes gene_type:complete
MRCLIIKIQIPLLKKNNMKKFKLVTIVGTRPEIIRLSSIIKKADKFFNHTLIHTGQNYDFELNEIFFRDLDIKKPKYFLDSASSDSNETIGNVISKSSPLLRKIKPDALLVLGDTYSCMSLIAAKHLKIPTFHMEAGNRCFDFRVPEEINRKIVDHTSDVNLTYSSISREYLINEGLNPQLVIKVGSPMKEVINNSLKEINQSKILKMLDIDQKKYFLFSSHRQENVSDKNNLNKIIHILDYLAENSELPIIVSTHPRTRLEIKKSKHKFHKSIKLLKPLGYIDYMKLQIHAKCVISDSGTINEEASILKFPAINIRETHERPEAMEESATIMSGLSSERFQQALRLIEDLDFYPDDVADYNVSNVSDKVLRTIISYTDYINQNIWKKI